MLKPVATAVGNWSLARDYQSVQGEVIPRTGQDEDGSFTWAVHYTVAGRNYETSRLSVLDDEAIDEPYNATVFKRLERAKAAGQTVEVWVSPRLPDAALLSRDLPVARLGRRRSPAPASRFSRWQVSLAWSAPLPVLRGMAVCWKRRPCGVLRAPGAVSFSRS